MAWLFFAVLLAGAPEARAEECPWGDSDKVFATATMTTVVVNDDVFLVTGGLAKADFFKVLQQCDAQRAAVLFGDWRDKRVATNVSAGVGVVFPLAFIATAIFASNAGNSKAAMLSELSRSSSK